MSFVISSAQRERMAHRLIMFFFSNMVCVYRSSFLFAHNIGGWLLRYFSYRTQPLTYTGNSSANLYKHVRREHIWSAMQNASSYDTRRPSLSIPNLLKQKKNTTTTVQYRGHAFKHLWKPYSWSRLGCLTGWRSMSAMPISLRACII